MGKKFNDPSVAAGTPGAASRIPFFDGTTGELSYITLANFQALSGWSGGGGLTTLSTPTLTATVISATQIDLSWTNVANESSYKLEWSANGTTGWTQIGGTIAANTTTFSHTGLTASTAYYYRVSAIGDGVTYATSGFGTANGTTSAAGGATFLTWATIGADMEQYNSNQGIRKKSTASTGWETPNLAACQALANETFGTGQELVVKVPSAANRAFCILLKTSGAGSLADNVFGMYVGSALTNNVAALVNGTSEDSEPIDPGDLVKIVYGSPVTFERSTNAGVSWSTWWTAVGPPANASGTYAISVQAYDANYGVDEIYLL
jgi:hypothetical protein